MLLLLLKEKLVNIQTIINFFVDSADILQYFCEELQSADKNWFETQKGFYPILDKFLKKFKHLDILKREKEIFEHFKINFFF